MKTQSFKLFAAALVLGFAALFGTASTASAQQVLFFEVPFEFHVGKTKFEAGKYELVKAGPSRYHLRNRDASVTQILQFDMPTGKTNRENAERLVFNRYDDETYFLHSLYDRRGEIGKELIESKFERELRKRAGDGENRLADKKKKPEQVSVVLNR